VRSVRPVGPLASVGLILPTLPWQENPVEPGITKGGKHLPTKSTTERLRHLVGAAERAGATGLWACDHLFWNRPLLEPFASLAVASTASTTATLGTCVLQLPMRSPAAVARQAATLQVLTDDRFILGLGVGSHPGEYAAANVDFSRRGQLLDEGIAALTQAWQDAGDPDVRYRIDPPTLRVPIWLAGSSEAAVSRTARVGDGWVPHFIPPEAYRSTRLRLFDQAMDHGRDPADIDTAVVVMVCTGDSAEAASKEGTGWLSGLYDLPPKAFARWIVAGTPEDCAEGIAAYHAAGAGHVVVMVAADQTMDHFGPLMEAFGSRTCATDSLAMRVLGVAP
jgi:alkanesulfonate monooxygenase SsuD/methylene tetrahydromethanopterin reductase-like flavin-dependent oxidoreductase (luciferase family)